MEHFCVKKVCKKAEKYSKMQTELKRRSSIDPNIHHSKVLVLFLHLKVNPYTRRNAPVLKISDGCRFIQFQALHFASSTLVAQSALKCRLPFQN